MALEIERKFLVKTGAWRRQAGPGVRYRQGYLSLEPGRTVRVRVSFSNLAAPVLASTCSHFDGGAIGATGLLTIELAPHPINPPLF